MNLAAWRRDCAADLAANRGYPKSQVLLVVFRTAHHLRASRSPAARPVYLAVGSFYKLFSEWLLGIELPASSIIGPGLCLRHGVGLVINPHAVIGSGVMLRQGVTIGNRRTETDCPVIGDRVDIGALAVLIGKITIGDDAKIGAGAVVVTDVPPGAVVVTRGTEIRPPRPPN